MGSASRASVRVAGLLLPLAGVAGFPASAQEAPASAVAQLLPHKDAVPAPGSMVIFFRGGQAGSNLGTVLRELIRHPDLVPVEDREVGRDDTLCDLLTKRGFPEPCQAYFPVIQALNPDLRSLTALSVGQKIRLPGVNITTRRSSKIFEAARQAMELMQNWAAFSPRLFQTKDSTRVEYDTLELVVRAPDQERLDRAVVAVGALELSNVSLEPIAFAPSIAKPFSRSASVVHSSCSHGDLGSVPVNYVEYAFEDEPAQPPSSPAVVSPTVYILDVPVNISPNLSASQPPGSWRCEWFQFSGRDHATHLASIIASKYPTLGFIGLEPSARIQSQPFMTVSDATPGAPPIKDSAALLGYRELFRRAHYRESLPVFLVAASFRNGTDYRNLPGGRLSSASQRFNGAYSAIEGEVKDQLPLLIVAAGQDRDQPEGMELDARTLMSPQNLGDLPNVVTVTACTRCKRRAATLAPDANFDPQRRFVHVAAPGGDDLPGWVNGEGIGAASGTSQAAAYVGGVAASMIARYPQRYRRAPDVKLRLQVTSAPIVSADGALAPASAKLSAGIVDPQLAALDPARDWVKTADGWRPVLARRWSKSQVRFRSDRGIESDRDLYSLLRLVQTESRDWHYVAYTDPDAEAGSTSALARAVDIGTLFDQSLRLELCEGSPIRIGDIQDFIPRLGGIPRQLQLADEECGQG